MTGNTRSSKSHAGVATAETEDWRNQARCRNAKPELFFPVGNTAEAQTQARAAKAICARCPVRSECLQWAIAAGAEADYGIWGGRTEEERRSLRRNQRRRRAS